MGLVREQPLLLMRHAYLGLMQSLPVGLTSSLISAEYILNYPKGGLLVSQVGYQPILLYYGFALIPLVSKLTGGFPAQLRLTLTAIIRADLPTSMTLKQASSCPPNEAAEFESGTSG